MVGISKSSFANDKESEEFRNWLSQFQLSERTLKEYNKVRKQYCNKYNELTQENVNRFLKQHPVSLYFFSIKRYLEYTQRADIVLPKRFKFRPARKRLENPSLEELKDIVNRRIENEPKLNPDCAYLLRLLSVTGMRIDEALGLRLSNFEFDKCIIRFFTKGGFERICKLPVKMSERLRTYITEERGLLGNERIFFTRTKNTASALRAFREQLGKIQGENDKDIEKIMQTHNFRRAIIEKIDDIYVAKSFIGHRRITTTERYKSQASEDKAREKGFALING